MNWNGFIIGILAFFIIGLFHPIVKILEYKVGKKAWWLFFIVGLGFLSASFFVPDFWSMLAGAMAFACFWSTFEMFKQHERVLLGRAKKNPGRKYE